jgi:hypothetical protein
MPESYHPSPEGMIEFLRLRGWSCRVSGFTTSGDTIFYQVEGKNGRNRIRVQGRTAYEAWNNAVLAAARYGLPEESPQSSSGS